MKHLGYEAFFSLRIATEITLEPIEPNDNVIEYRIDVCPHDEESESLEPVGHFDVWLFNIGDEEGSIYEMFDAHHEEAYRLYHHLFDRDTDRWKEELDAELLAGLDLIYFQWAEFPPELRRSRVVLAAAERIIQVLGGGCGFAALTARRNLITGVHRQMTLERDRDIFARMRQYAFTSRIACAVEEPDALAIAEQVSVAA